MSGIIALSLFLAKNFEVLVPPRTTSRRAARGLFFGFVFFFLSILLPVKVLSAYCDITRPARSLRPPVERGLRPR
jgi:hypothetical protein